MARASARATGAKGCDGRTGGSWYPRGRRRRVGMGLGGNESGGGTVGSRQIWVETTAVGGRSKDRGRKKKRMKNGRGRTDNSYTKVANPR